MATARSVLAPLGHPTYRRLFAAQVLSLVGTGLATVALGLLAWELAGAEAGIVLGTALAIKMAAYVGVAPLAGALAERLPRRPFLVALDLVRAAIALALPFVTEIWQIYALIFLLQAASAAFTPAFQATIPDVLPDERDYTRALSLSRLAYDLESLLSPVLAAALLALMSFHWLFAGTAGGFVASAALVMSAALPASGRDRQPEGFVARATRGVRIYLATPRLRGLLALNMAAAAAGAFVIVDTVVLVRGPLGGSEADVALALGAFGAGSMVAALALPPLLERVPDRRVMAAGAGLLAAALTAFGAVVLDAGPAWLPLLAAWTVLGAGYSAVLTPSGRLLRRSAHEADRPAVFAAQFALSHACWLVTYPLAGFLGRAIGMGWTLLVMAALAWAGLLLALRLWPAGDPEVVEHAHPDLPSGHPHLGQAGSVGGVPRHAHRLVIDEHHPHWPRQG